MRYHVAPVDGRDDVELRKLAKDHFPGMVGTNRLRKDGVIYYRVGVLDDDATDPAPWVSAMSKPTAVVRKIKWRAYKVPLVAVVVSLGSVVHGLVFGGVGTTDLIPLLVAVPFLKED